MKKSLRIYESLGIDCNATAKKMISVLEEYKVLISGPKRFETIITPLYENKIKGKGKISRPTENTAIRNIEKEKYIEWVENGVNRLTGDWRLIIEKKFMNNQRVIDMNVYMDIGVSDRTYYRLKKEALIKLAIILNTTVTK